MTPSRRAQGRSRRPTRKEILSRPGVLARYVAIESLHDRTSNVLPSDRLWPLADRYNLRLQDRGLAYEILCGTIKRRATLDVLIKRYGGRSSRSIERELLDVLRVGVYQLVFLDHVPAFAAVDITSTVAGLYGGQRQVNFVNAVLRNVQRGIVDTYVPIDDQELRWMVPKAGDVAVKFDSKVLPNPDSPTEYLASAYSYPKWLVKRWLRAFGPERTKSLLSAGNGRPAMICRPNLLKFRQQKGVTDAGQAGEQLAAMLEDDRCRVRRLEQFGAVDIESGPPVVTLRSFHDGWFQLQDITSQAVAWALAPKPHECILDLCAGLGTKTTQIAELTFDQAKLYASDRQSGKLENLKTNASRLGIEHIVCVTPEALSSSEYDAFFDVVLADVPCSNTGVMSRRPEVRWRLRETDIRMFARCGVELLMRAAKLIKPTGRVVYSTCSIESEENEAVVERFLSSARSWRIAGQSVVYPETDQSGSRTVCEGGYWAVLEQST